MGFDIITIAIVVVCGIIGAAWLLKGRQVLIEKGIIKPKKKRGKENGT